MGFEDFIKSALSAAFGAVIGAVFTFLFALHRINQKKKSDYRVLLLLVYEHILVLHNIFAGALKSDIKVVEGVKCVVFDVPLMIPDISTEQLEHLMDVCSNKNMPSALIHMKYYCKSMALRMQVNKFYIMPVQNVINMRNQLWDDMYDIRREYKKVFNQDFPLSSN